MGILSHFKLSAGSYSEIALSLGGVKGPEEILFVTDMLAEAIASKKAGMQVFVSSRPGNIPLDQQILNLSKPEVEQYNFRTIHSLQEVADLI